MKLTPSEKQVLSYLIFPETFNSILEESGMQQGALRDDLMHLVSHGYIEVFEPDGIHSVSPFYDSDNLQNFAFKATKTGLKVIQSHAV
jgi:hypothetical protein